MRILVTDGGERAALAVVRSLGAAGHEVVVGAASDRSIAGASRFAAGQVRLPDPLGRPAAFVDAVAELVAERAIGVVIPVSEAALRLMLPARERLGNALVPFPSAEVFDAASDKQHLLALARELEIAVPEQIVIADPVSAPLGLEGMSFPVVLKPATSVVATEDGQRKVGVRHVRHPSELTAALRELKPAAYPILAQRRILGPGSGIFLLRWDGRILARFAHRRIREKPPSGGVSVYRESIEPPADHVAQAERLLAALDWSGVAMVEFKIDHRTGTPYLMEVNGRFWGSLQLAVDAGVDFPALLLDAAVGRLPEHPPEPRSGVRLRWELGDLDHLLARLRHSRAELSLPDDAPGRWRTALSVLRPWRPGERWEMLRPSDPAPFFAELRNWVREALARDDHA